MQFYLSAYDINKTCLSGRVHATIVINGGFLVAVHQMHKLILLISTQKSYKNKMCQPLQLQVYLVHLPQNSHPNLLEVSNQTSYPSKMHQPLQLQVYQVHLPQNSHLNLIRYTRNHIGTVNHIQTWEKNLLSAYLPLNLLANEHVDMFIQEIWEHWMHQ